ncbi:hypothetical protein A2W24_02605 [Microgenomates group bacterium RBG_16_45_19]|nr:MAG: hypothetical protein A2W24_02605 [Microgenomates group bacterium RBG_16_45_19]
MKSFLTKYWALLVLGLTPIIITVTTLTPTQYFAGWDNFTTYFNLKSNLFRTFFATWRAYRGLGVASDTEVVDLSRQLFYLILSFIPLNLIDQIYTLLTLALGVFGVYFLTHSLIPTKKPSFGNSFAALIASFFYFLNLNTLAVYYYPMPMYIARFAWFPWVLYSFIRYIRHPKPKNLLLVAIVCFLASSAYLTATVFFTLLIPLVFILLCYHPPDKTALKLISVFLCINAFWLLPFTDYAVRKSALIPQATILTQVNESQFNQAPNHFNWSKLLSLYPSFFYIDSAKDLDSQTSISLYPNQDQFNPATHPFLLLFVSLGLIGSLLILIKKPHLTHIWIPATLITSLFLLRQNYPPLNQLYAWLSTYIPYFNVVFRFGDAKFNNLIALTASLAIGILIYYCLTAFPKSKTARLTIISIFPIILILTLKQYLTFLTGNFISSLSKVSFPKAYQDIAAIINQNPDQARVLHLPNDSLSYFKSHRWGYFGSTFMAFKLNQPLFDQAFAPASPENDQIDQQIQRLAHNSANLKNLNDFTDKLRELQTLLSLTNTRYLIHDQTVGRHNLEENVTYWGEFHEEDYTALIQAAIQAGIISPVKTYTLPINSPANTITLYQTVFPGLKTQTLSSAELLNPHQEQVVTLSLTSPLTYYQSSALSGTLFPFYLQSPVYTPSNNILNASLSPPIPPGQITTTPAVNDTHNYQIYLSATDQDLLISVNFVPYPFKTNASPSIWQASLPLNSLPPLVPQTLDSYAADWHILPYTNISQLRLSLGETVIPLPYPLPQTPTYLTTITSSQNPLTLTLLEPESTQSLNPTQFTYTDKPNCYQDALEGYAHNLTTSATDVSLTTSKGTTCLTAPLTSTNEATPYYEINFTYQLQTTDLTPKPVIDSPNPNHQQILESVSTLPSANYFTGCLIHPESNHCLNNHHTFNSQGKNLTLPTSRTTTAPPQLFITLPTINQQTAKLTITNPVFTTYRPLSNTPLNLNTSYPTAQTDNLDSINLPYSLSPESYYFNPDIDALRVYYSPCLEPDSYHTAKVTANNQLLLYHHNCSVGAYTILPYNSDHFYLWQTDYQLHSGKFPTFELIGDYQYLNQYLSLSQGYPQNPGYRSTSTYIYPYPGINDQNSRQYTISENSKNQGIITIGDVNLMQLPTAWQNLTITPNTIGPNQFDPNTQVIQTQSLLPSLWKIDLQTTSREPANLSTFLHFSQAYDDQWHLYQTHHPLFALLGIGQVDADHVKVNGLTNGWIFNPSANNPKSTTYYALYTPERLAILGWLLTLGTFLIIILPKLKRTKTSPKPATKTN